jgi:hypothetical protein
VKDRFDTEEWGRHAQPSWNASGEVPAALRALADPGDLDRQRAYHRLLYALGNDHAGTYFPVVVPAIRALGAILRDGSLVARLRALDALVDLVGSFWPEPGYEDVETDGGGRRPLKELVLETAKALRADVWHRRRTPETDEEAKLAGDLLELFDE